MAPALQRQSQSGAKSMTLRIDRAQKRVLLSGDFRSEHVRQVKAELDRRRSPVALELEKVGPVDVEAIRFPNSCDAAGVSVLHGSVYIRTWTPQEREWAGGTAEREKSTVMEMTANVVLVHGAWADGSSWSKVIPLPKKKSLNVMAAQLPFTSVEADIAVTKNLLSMLRGPVVQPPL